MSNDPVSSPAHYTYLGEKIADHGVIDADLIEVRHVLTAAFENDPYLWNAAKYLFRAGRKDNARQDLEKAKQYIEFQLELLDLRATYANDLDDSDTTRYKLTEKGRKYLEYIYGQGDC